MDFWSFFYGICLTIDSIIFGLVSGFFKIFMAVAGAELMTSEMYENIANKVYMIIGVVMLFALAYGMIRAIINPEQGGAKGELGGPRMIKAVIVAVIGLAITPVIFNLLYRAQNVFLKNDIIAAVFFRTDDASYHAGSIDLTPTNPAPSNNDGTSTGSATNAGSGSTADLGDVEYNREMKQIGGAVTATMVWRAFFRPNADYTFVDENGNQVDYENAPKYIVGDIKAVYAANMWGGIAACAVAGGIAALLAPFTLGASLIVGGAVLVGCGAYVAIDNTSKMQSAPESITLEQAYNYSSATGDFSWYKCFVNKISTSEEAKEVSYSIVVSALVGVFVSYAFLTFSIDMAVRAAKLAYCQMIAPVPIIMQIIPNFKDTLTKTFIPFVLKTFCEIFIRLSTVYIITYLICHLNDVVSFETLGKNIELNWFEYAVALVVLILGLILFARKIPDLLSSSLGIKTEGMGGLTPKAFKEKLSDSRFMDAAGMLGAGATGLAQGWKSGFAKGQWKKGQGAKKFWSGIGHGLLDSTRKNLGSLSRYGRKQFLSGDSTPSKSFGDARKALRSAVDEAGDHMEKVDAKQKEARDRARQNEKLKEKAEERYKKVLNDSNGDVAKAEKAREDYINRNAFKYAIKPSLDINTRGARQWAQTWVGGTVDLTIEDTAIKLGGALADFNDNARNVAYNKGDATVKALKKVWDDYQNTSVGSYKDGYNDQTYNEELKRLQDNSAEYRIYDNLLQRKKNGENISDSSLSAAQAAWDKARKKIVEDLDVRTKWQSDELTTKIAEAKAAAEAAADEWVQVQLATSGSEINGMAQSVVSEYASFIAKNGSVQVQWKEGKAPTTIANMVSDVFGKDAATKGAINTDGIKQANQGYVFTYSDSQGDHTITYKKKVDANGKPILNANGQEVFETFDAKGENRISDLNGRNEYVAGDFFTMVSQQIGNNAISKPKFEARTAAARAKEVGKGVKQYLPNTPEYREKATRKRQADSGKNGK